MKWILPGICLFSFVKFLIIQDYKSNQPKWTGDVNDDDIWENMPVDE